MSGEKCAQARLTRQAEQELQHAFEESRQIPDATALIASVKEESRLFKVDFSRQAEQYMKAEYESYLRAENSFEVAEKEFFKRIKAIRNRSNSSGSGNLTVQQMQELTQQVRDDSTKVREANDQLHTAAKELRSNMEPIREHIRERVIEREREELIQKENRAKVSVLLREFEERLGVDESLYWVRDKIENLLKKGKSLIGENSQMSQQDVDEFSQALEKLAQEGREAELNNRRRWEIAKRISSTFEASGFEVIQNPGDPYSVAENDIHFTHQTQGGDYLARIGSTISLDRSIFLTMEGVRGSEGGIRFEADENCHDRLDQIIALAKAKGLIIESINWKGPGGGWQQIYKDKGEDTTADATTRSNRYGNRMDEQI